MAFVSDCPCATSRIAFVYRQSEDVASSRGKKPASIPKRQMPPLHTSAAKPLYPPPPSTSGAAYDFEPHTSVRTAGTTAPSAARSYTWARPKSQTLQRSSAESSTFSSLRSRCATPALWMWSTAAISWPKYRRASGSVSEPFFTTRPKSSPLGASSMKMKTRLSISTCSSSPMMNSCASRSISCTSRITASRFILRVSTTLHAARSLGVEAEVAKKTWP